MEQTKQNPEQLLQQGITIQLAPQGYSMYPVLIPGKDQAVIAPYDGRRLKRGEVVLYRRENSILVLHRIWKAAGEGYYFVGDNQSEIEGPIDTTQLRGVLVGIQKPKGYLSTKSWLYRICTGIWLFLRPVRWPISVHAARLKKTFRR